jgi:hypothetical protein
MTDPELITLLREMEGRIDARLDRIDARLDKIDARIDKLENRFEGKLESVEARLTARIEEIAVRESNRVEDRIVSAFGSYVEAIQLRLKVTDVTTTGITERMGILEERLLKIELRLFGDKAS